MPRHDASLPVLDPATPAAWDHPAFLRAAWSALRQSPFAQAAPGLRAGPGACHATLALAWARLVEAAIQASGAGSDLGAFLDLHPELREPAHLLRHYSPERLASEHARREFVLPDREPLPGPRSGTKGKESMRSR